MGGCVDGDVAKGGRHRLVQGLTSCVMASDMLMRESSRKGGRSGQEEGGAEEHGGFEHEDVHRWETHECDEHPL